MSDSENDLFGEPEDQLDEQGLSPETPARESVHRPAFLKRYAPSHEVKNAWTTRLPKFLNVEPQPFNSEKFRSTDKSTEELALESNTVRWTYAATENEAEQKVTRVSNARIVEWSDGSQTLQLGDEHFEIKTHEQSDPTFVVIQDEEEPVLATRHLVSHSMSFIPTSTTSGAHALLAKALAQKQENGQIRVGSVDTVEDPDKVQREIERAEQAKEKARRKLAAQRDEVVSYTDRSVKVQGMDVDGAEEDEDDDMGEDRESEAQDSAEEEEAQESEEDDELRRRNDESESDDEKVNRLNQIKHQTEPIRRKVLDDEDSD